MSSCVKGYGFVGKFGVRSKWGRPKRFDQIFKVFCVECGWSKSYDVEYFEVCNRCCLSKVKHRSYKSKKRKTR